MEDGPEGSLRLSMPPKGRGYADAQIDDYHRLPRRRFRWRPPLRLSLRARASSPTPLGTLGFGFWNDPFSLSLGQGGAARRLPASPRAIWFFYASPPNDFTFSAGLAGHGWRAMTLSGPRVPSLLLLPAAMGVVIFSRLPGVRRPLLRAALRSVRASEASLAASLGAWHEYVLEWHACEAIFTVDGQTVLVAPHPPPPPLGFVAWIDNQYAVASPKAGFGFGVLATSESQWLEIRDLSLEEL